MITAFFALSAHAVDVKFCVDIETQFADSYPNVDPVYDDYMNDNTEAVPLRGVRWCATPVGGGLPNCAFGASEGATRGCATLGLSLIPYQIDIRSEAVITRGGAGFNTLRVLQAPTTDPDPDPYVHVFETSFTPLPNPPIGGYHQYHLTSAGSEWEHLAMLGWALHHRDGGLAGQVFWEFPDSGTGGNGVHCDLDGDGIDADECGGADVGDHDAVYATSSSRATVVHEFGHYLYYRRNEGHGTRNHPGADAENCFFDEDLNGINDDIQSGHTFQQKEMLNEAWHEGWANFYVASVFNNQTETDCRFQYSITQDWDIDLDPDPPRDGSVPQKQSYNCEIKPDKLPGGGDLEPLDALPALVDAHDYLYDSNVGLGCGTVLANRGTTFDFVRFWWDLTTDPENDWDFIDVMNVVDRTDADTWIGGLNDTDPDGVGVGEDLPTPTIEAALVQAVTDGVITAAMRQQWLDESHLNGTDR